MKKNAANLFRRGEGVAIQAQLTRDAQAGLTPKTATPAGGAVILTGNPGTKIADLLQFRPAGGGQRYQTTQPGTIDTTGSVTLPARALQSGSQGNLADNTPGTLLMAPAGIDNTLTIARMVGGSKAESDAALLARLLEVIRRPPAAISTITIAGRCLFPASRKPMFIRSAGVTARWMS